MPIAQTIRLCLSVPILFGAIITSALASAPPARLQFVIQDLGPLPPVATDTALGLNNSGVVTLWSRTGVVSVRAAFWTQGSLVPLEPYPAGYHSSLARGLNDRGQWVGWAVTGANLVDSLAATRGFVCTGLQTRLLPTLGGRDSRAYAINGGGIIVGDADRADGHCHAFRDNGTTMSDLGTLPGGGFSQAVAVNQAGDAVGVSDRGVSAPGLPKRHAVLWHGGHIRDLGTLPAGRTSSALAVNGRGQVAGYSESEDGYHAVLWTAGRIQDLGTLGSDPSTARGLNDRGEVVGASGLAHRIRHAFYWRDGHMTDLNTLIPAASWVLTQADAINNRGQIACQGRHGPGALHALLLTPKTQPHQDQPRAVSPPLGQRHPSTATSHAVLPKPEK